MPYNRELTALLLNVERLLVATVRQSTESSSALDHATHAARGHAPTRDVEHAELTHAQRRLNAALTVVEAEMAKALKDFEERLEGVGDDAQLANVDLQNVLQQQQQALQMLTAIAKLLNDTTSAIIRKIGD